MKGYVQVYTGNGKGKTTAAIGMAVRAVGAGLKVFIGQFVKGMYYSELKSLERFYPDLIIKQYGTGCFIFRTPKQEDIDVAKKGFEEVKEVIKSGKYDLVILDEINIALYYKLVSLDDVLSLIDEKPENVELVLTGRNAPQEVIDKADLVTEMKEIKHYYTKGVEAREGIEK
ncbi:MAG: cob(I)alamin adenosyltransferase [Thermosediminibacterales bacterium]|nr:cob(I)alamin adenosyltransferase [Thermosediminibacterales bacterium]MDK2836761.1 cob(I)alamin adenosyltransferase [Thermosediminibacterales bacterium]